uniref:Uncharacterized protein n=1 Tax=Pelodiscus sinensis TaxID=13735 RepID=K7EYX9_PELSI
LGPEDSDSEDGGPEDPFDTGTAAVGVGPDSYPSLKPVKALAASAPTAEQILQTQRLQAVSQSSIAAPLPFAPALAPASSYRSASHTVAPYGPPLVAPSHNEQAGGLSECCREALRRGDVQLLQAFPIVYAPERPARHEALPYELVKELRKFVKDYGLQSSYMMNLVVAISESYVMALHDCRTLLRLLLSPAQYAVWDTEYHDGVTLQVMDNITNGVNVGIDELIGQGQYATPQAQAQMNRLVFTQATSLTLRALRQGPSFATVRQGPQ